MYLRIPRCLPLAITQARRLSVPCSSVSVLPVCMLVTPHDRSPTKMQACFEDQCVHFFKIRPNHTEQIARIPSRHGAMCMLFTLTYDTAPMYVYYSTVFGTQLLVCLFDGFHPIFFPQNSLVLRPSSNSDPGSYSRPFFPLRTTVRAFMFITRRIQRYLLSSTCVELYLLTLVGALSSYGL